jgi:hypothetical protein
MRQRLQLNRGRIRVMGAASWQQKRDNILEPTECAGWRINIR